MAVTRNLVRTVLGSTLAALMVLSGLALPASAVQDIDAEQYFVELINGERSGAGLGTVQSALDVRDVAYAWSVNMANERRMYHNPSYYEQYGHWLRAAENVGWTTISNPDDPAQVRAAVERLHQAFMNSDGHRANIMHPDHDQIGVGVEIRENSCPAGVSIPDCVWVTENFRKWDGTQPAGGLQDPYADSGTRDSSGSTAPSATISDKIHDGGFDGDDSTVERLGKSGDSAIQISKARFGADEAKHAILSRDDVFADSLAATPLTADGPMLFTASNGLDSYTRNELDRVLPGGATVYLLGGEAAISAGVESTVRDMGYRVVRLSGADRIRTALAIADEVRNVYGDNNTVLVARAYGPDNDPNGTAAWVDSVTAGSWAASSGTPIVISPTRAMPSVLRNWLNADAPRTSILLGGTVALSDTVASAAPNPTRVSGKDRTSTATAVAKQLWGVTSKSNNREFVVIDGWASNGWYHGMAAAGVAADNEAPVLLAYGAGGTDQPAATKQMVGSCTTDSVDLLLVGGLGDDVAGTLDALDGTAC